MFVLDKFLKLLLFWYMILHIWILHSRIHIYKSVCKDHVLLIYDLLLVPFTPETSSINNIPNFFLILVPFWMVLVFPYTHWNKLSHHVLILIKLVCSFNQRSLIFSDSLREFTHFIYNPSSRFTSCSLNFWRGSTIHNSETEPCELSCSHWTIRAFLALLSIPCFLFCNSRVYKIFNILFVLFYMLLSATRAPYFNLIFFNRYSITWLCWNF